MSSPPPHRAPSSPRHLHLVQSEATAAGGDGATVPSPPAVSLDLDSLYRSYSRLVASIALRILGRHDEAEEVVQDVFVEAWKWISRIESPGAIKHWFVTVTVRAARRRLRRRKVLHWLGVEKGLSYEEVAGSEASPSERALLAEVYKTLDTLPVDQRLAWTLRTVEGESMADVAALCGCSLATAKRRVAAASEAIEKGVRP